MQIEHNLDIHHEAKAFLPSLHARSMSKAVGDFRGSTVSPQWVQGRAHVGHDGQAPRSLANLSLENDLIWLKINLLYSSYNAPNCLISDNKVTQVVILY